MQKYLIFGATGSVGSNLAIQLSEANKEIHLIGRNDEDLEKLSSELGCDYTVLDILSDDIYENLKNRTDQRTQVSRQSFEDIYSDDIIKKTVVSDIKHQFSFPFSEVSSLRMTTNLRFDKVTTLSNSPTTLKSPNDNFILFVGLL